MKQTTLLLAAIALLLLAGCSVETIESEKAPADTISTAENITEESNTEEIRELITTFNGQQDKLLVTFWPILEYETNIVSKSMLSNALLKISKFNEDMKVMEATLGEIEGFEFENKESFVSTNREFIETAEEIVTRYTKLYHYQQDLMEQTALEKDNKIENLLQAIINCRCGTVDCNAYKDSSLKFMSSSIEIFKRIKDKYGVQKFDDVIQTWTKEKEICEKHWPNLIKKSKNYGPTRCYQINEDYNKYLKDLDQVEITSEEELLDDIAQKWLISLMDYAIQMDEILLDVDNVRAEVAE